jgi:transaldolase/glucose-6-phosphate isomerase
MSSSNLRVHYGSTNVEQAVRARLRWWDDQGISQRIWKHDPALWTDDPAGQDEIIKRMGWIDAPEIMAGKVEEMTTFAEEIHQAGFTHTVLLGMGGSSLAPEVYALVIGEKQGFPQFRVLDSTDPGAVADVEAWCNLETTLFIVASKSGGTIETRTQADYFYERVRSLKGERTSENFIAITDPGTGLEAEAKVKGYRCIFPGLPSIGGRYSAFSPFGLIPAALMGIDVGAVLARSRLAMSDCGPDVSAAENPGVLLGILLGEFALAGRDKVTFLLPERWASFANWAEQLIAESTGKQGKGILPVALEAPGSPQAYSDDRLFITVDIPNMDEPELEHSLLMLEEAGHPVIRIHLQAVDDLGYEYYRWAFAVPAASVLLHINPFDQPNVQESKANTERMLKVYEEQGVLPELSSVLSEGGVRVYGQVPGDNLAAALRAFLEQVRKGDYIALQAYLTPHSETWEAMQSLRLFIRDTLKVATTLAYGPRFLHSTGQLHKGGAPNGVFIQFTSDRTPELAIPGRSYTFGTLIDAQALGDWQALTARGLRVLRIHLGTDVAGNLARLKDAFNEAMG